MNILLIAGHGGTPYDPGAVSGGFTEAVLAREVTFKLKTMLEKNAFVTVFDTNTDMYKYLSKKSFDFKKFDKVYEIHFNAGAGDSKGNGKTTGSEILISSKKKNTKEDLQILKNLEGLGFKNRGIKTKSDLRNMNICSGQGVDYSLIEICFIDDRDDMKIYSDNPSKIASAIADGIIPVPELTTPNDIVWELGARNIISDKQGILSEMAENPNGRLYWLARKAVNFMRSKGV